MPYNHAEVLEIEGQLTLTFEGLARLAHHVIAEFVWRGPKVEREDFDWRSALPNVLRMPLAPEYWIGRPDGYSEHYARQWLQTFLLQVLASMLRTPGAALTDLTAILDKIEESPLSSVKASERKAMLALYHLFIVLAGPNYERVRHHELLERYGRDFREPCLEYLAICLVTGEEFPWLLPEVEGLFASYWRHRHHKNAFALGELLEAMFTLRLAELNRLASNETRAGELITFAVEAFPGQAGIRGLEEKLDFNRLTPIVARDILPPPETEEARKAVN